MVQLPLFSLAVIFLLLINSCREPYSETRYYPHLDSPKPLPGSEKEAASFIRGDFIAEPGFSSHLPLVVLDTKGVELTRSLGILERVELSVIDRGLGNNKLSDDPVYSSFIRISAKGGAENRKGFFTFTLTDNAGIEKAMPLLGMDSGSDWVLAGSLRDRSLMRNYLAYCLAAELSPETPNLRFCEVFFKEGENYKYQGVFLLNEEVRQAAGRGKFLSGKGINYIILRDSKNNDGHPLNTWGYRQGIVDGRLSVVYPKDNQGSRSIEAAIEKAEKIIYSEEHKVFTKYSDIIDIKSFIDYYVLSEFLQNYNAGLDSTYMYVNSRGKIKMALVWDNDCILGNNYSESFDPLEITVQNAPFYEQLTRDVNFLNQLKRRYSELRRTILAENEVIRLIDETASYLGPAQIRDWKRWANEYALERSYPLFNLPDSEGVIIRKNTETFDQELIKMKYLTVLHATILGDSIHRMSWKLNLFDSSYNTRASTFLLVLFCLLYVAAVRIGRYH